MIHHYTSAIIALAGPYSIHDTLKCSFHYDVNVSEKTQNWWESVAVQCAELVLCNNNKKFKTRLYENFLHWCTDFVSPVCRNCQIINVTKLVVVWFYPFTVVWFYPCQLWTSITIHQFFLTSHPIQCD